MLSKGSIQASVYGSFTAKVLRFDDRWLNGLSVLGKMLGEVGRLATVRVSTYYGP